MTETQLAWLAGLLEGEACFLYQRTPWIKLGMTDCDIVERAAFLMGTHCHKMKTIRPNRKQEYRACLCGDGAIEIMRAILPHMGSRRSAKIKEVLAAAAARPGMAYGERCGPSRLTDAQATEIRNLYIPNERYTDRSSGALAKKYGVSRAAIKYVVKTRRNADGGQPIRSLPS